jgi:hypothetical protein
MKSIALAFALVVAGSGCAVGSIDEGQRDEDVVSQTSAMISAGTTPAASKTLYTRATYDAVLGKTMLDIATSPIPAIGATPDHDPHASPYDQDDFLVVFVNIQRAGKNNILSVFGAHAIGPGGGCIHFSVAAGVGDHVTVTSVVKFAGGPAQVAKGGDIIVLPGDWHDDPTVALDPEVH